MSNWQDYRFRQEKDNQDQYRQKKTRNMACTTVVCGRVLTTNVLLRVAALVSPKNISFNSFEEISKKLNQNVLIQALAIVDILLARFGGHNGYTLNLPQNEKWLVIIASGGYVIILGAMVGSYLRGQQVPQFLVKLGSILPANFHTASLFTSLAGIFY